MLELVVLVITGAGFGWLIYQSRYKYDGSDSIDFHHHESTSLLSYFTPRKGVEMDTRGKGFTDISSAAGTHVPRGFWGGHKTDQVNKTQTPHQSSLLFYRSAKYHPWSDLQRHEQRRQGFNAIYSSRVHNST